MAEVTGVVTFNKKIKTFGEFRKFSLVAANEISEFALSLWLKMSSQNVSCQNELDLHENEPK